MFSREDIDAIKGNTSRYIICQINSHNVTIRSRMTGHDWIIVSNYTSPDCYILHRHSGKYPYHRQQGRYKSLKDALNYIDYHEKWYERYKHKLRTM